MPSNFDPQRHHRRSIRLKGYDYSQAGAYFVTIVAQNRAAFFGEIIDGEMVLNAAGEMVVAVWKSMIERFRNVELGIYVLMPNHFHAIVIIRPFETGAISQTGATIKVAPTGNDDSVGAGLVPAPVPGEENIPLNGEDLGDERVTETKAAIKAAPTNSPTLGQIIGAFKSITKHEYIRGLDEKGWPQFDKRLWQRNYYEHIIRNDREMDAIWRYIENNPVMWATDDENPNRCEK
jgi:putative transposase